MNSSWRHNVTGYAPENDTLHTHLLSTQGPDPITKVSNDTDFDP